MKRCDNCENCKKLAKVKTSVLACCGTPKNNARSLSVNDMNHADDGVVAVWNDSLKTLPCLNPVDLRE